MWACLKAIFIFFVSQPGLLPNPEGSALPDFVLPPWQTSAWVVETEPKEAGAWLAALPLADSVQAAQQIYQALFTLNRMPLEADDRLVLMELYRKPVAAVAAGLQPHFARLTLPLKPRLKQLADFLCQLHMEMAHGYKHVLKAGLDERKPWESDAFLLALERAIRYLGEVLLRSYQVYMPAPPGVWKEIHGFYRYAEQHGQAHRLPGHRWSRGGHDGDTCLSAGGPARSVRAVSVVAE